MQTMDPLNILRNKIIDLKKIRDQVNSELLGESQTITLLEERMSTMQQELNAHKQSASEKDRKLKKLNDIINSSDSALNKLISNTDKLNYALDEELKST